MHNIFKKELDIELDILKPKPALIQGNRRHLSWTFKQNIIN